MRQRQIADAVAEALVDHGVAPLDERMAAETALGVWRVAVAEWVCDPQAQPLPDVVAATAGAVRSL